MSRCEFLGWDRPLLERVVDWLWARRDEMAGMVVVVPTAQAGRRLREALAERGACLAPRVVTPGWFMEVECAPQGAELVAWVEALEAVEDWQDFQQIFPVPPGDGEEMEWSMPLAKSLLGLEKSLQEGGLTPESAARRMGKSMEAGRWSQLAELWRRKETRLGDWGMRGRSRALEAVSREAVSGRLVLAGVPDLSALAVDRLKGADCVCLVGGNDAADFDEWGRPLPDKWNDRVLPFPGTVELVADPRQQAQRAVERVAELGIGADDLALGSADEEVAEELVQAFKQAGWVVHNPAGSVVSRVKSWWALWRAWLARPVVATAIDLLGAAETAGITGGKRHQRVRELSVLRDQWLAVSGEDVKRAEAMMVARAARGTGEDDDYQPIAGETMERLEMARGMFLRQPFGEAMARLLERVDPAAEWVEVREWLATMGAVIGQVKRSAAFWLDVVIAGLGEGVKEAPEGRVADVKGWLELLHEPGQHLLICGMNEGKVPAGSAGDPWLNDAVRELLDLTTDVRRAARDAYVFHAMMAARRQVDVFLGKSSLSGDALLPSRLLLAAKGMELAERVKLLFREVEPPDAGLCWVPDWKWRMPEVPLRPRLSVTALRDYLACPLRFFLKHGAGMYARDGERVEWNARDFGNVVHLVLERWGRDETARDFSKTEVLSGWLHEQLEEVVAALHGTKPPLAVRIQIDGVRQRLEWFAREQACLRAGGWRVKEVEKKYVIPVDGVDLVGKVDRIDQHEDGRIRVLDYKTYSERKEVEKDHRVEIRTNTILPAHLDGVDEVGCVTSKGRPARWTNLQVPLYACFIENVDELGYFILGATEAHCGLEFWPDFSTADRDAAMVCARWIIGRVKAGVFGPAAERVAYDDFEALALGRSLEEMMEREAR